MVIYLRMHGKYNRWDYVTMTLVLRLFKVWRTSFLHHKPISFALPKHKLFAQTPTHPLISLMIIPKVYQSLYVH